MSCIMGSYYWIVGFRYSREPWIYILWGNNSMNGRYSLGAIFHLQIILIRHRLNDLKKNENRIQCIAENRVFSCVKNQVRFTHSVPVLSTTGTGKKKLKKPQTSIWMCRMKILHKLCKQTSEVMWKWEALAALPSWRDLWGDLSPHWAV